jgi:CRP/FNR family transcriptional regulator, anaerobic regulatory protein
MITPNDFDQLAAAYPVFSELDLAVRKNILQAGHCQKASSGSILFDLDYPCREFLLVLQGVIRISRPSQERELLLYRVLPGGTCIVSVSCLLGGSNYPVRGVVEKALSGLTIPRSLFHQIIHSSDPFRKFIFRFFAERVTVLMELVQDLAFTRVDQRLARLLLSGGDQVLCTHQELADDLGTAREVISRYLKEFEARGIVRLARGQIVLLDRQALDSITRR